MTNKELILKFYQSFSYGNAQEMAACYHDEIEFEDPAFGKLKGDRAKKMWAMLLSNKNSQLQIQYGDIEANDKKGKAKWTADYLYGVNGIPVKNHVSAYFEFKDGKIIKHRDRFDIWVWSQQSLGLIGYLFGWTNFLQKKICSKANLALDRYISKTERSA